MMQRSSRFVQLEGSIEASEISGVQGLDPKENFHPFIWLVITKECISGFGGFNGSSMPVLVWLGYQFQEGSRNTKIISEIFQ